MNKQKERFCVSCRNFIKIVQDDVMDEVVRQDKQVKKVEATTKATSVPTVTPVPVSKPAIPTTIPTTPMTTHTHMENVPEMMTSLSSTLGRLRTHLDSIHATNMEEISRTCHAIHQCALALSECQKLLM